MVAHHAKGEGEITDLKSIREHTGLKMYTDADLAKDISTRRSVTSVVHEYNEIIFAWKIVKQTEVALHTNGSEIRAFLQELKELKYLEDSLNHLNEQSKIQQHHMKTMIRPSIKIKQIY